MASASASLNEEADLFSSKNNEYALRTSPLLICACCLFFANNCETVINCIAYRKEQFSAISTKGANPSASNSTSSSDALH